jgi:hypothetical protein
MMKRAWIFVLAGAFTHCNTPPDQSATTVATAPATEAPSATSAPTAASTASGCPATVRAFLSWYYQNQERLATYQVLSYPQQVAASFEVPAGHISKSGRYELNEAGLTRYLSLLDSTGFFSPAFLTSKRTELTHKAAQLASFGAADGPPPGFDADLLFYTQELYEPEDLDSLRVAPQGAGPATVLLPIMGRRWEFATTQQQGRCMITNIAFK